MTEQSVQLSKSDKEKKEGRKRKSGDEESGHPRISKKEAKKQRNEKCKEAMVSGQRICIDLRFEDTMSEKELRRLSLQLSRVYGANRQYIEPAHIYFSSFNKDGPLYKECVKKHDGFQNYKVEMTEKGPEKVFPKADIVYLTPDSPNVLDSVSKDKVYIIGGLVDETINKNITSAKAEKEGLKTAHLPIDEHLKKGLHGTFKKILTVNQVFEILMMFGETGDWTEALTGGIPKRTGFVANTNNSRSKP